MSQPFKLDKSEWMKIGKTAIWAFGSFIVAVIPIVVLHLQSTQWVVLVPIINTLGVVIGKFVSNNQPV